MYTFSPSESRSAAIGFQFFAHCGGFLEIDGQYFVDGIDPSSPWGWKKFQ